MTLRRAALSAMLEAGRRGSPLEACGLLGGRDGIAEVFYPCRNAAASPVFFTIDPAEVLACLKAMEREGQELAGIFHSHPATRAYPSSTDLLHAHYPQTPYLILSLATDQPDLRAFDLSGPAPREIQLVVVD